MDRLGKGRISAFGAEDRSAQVSCRIGIEELAIPRGSIYTTIRELGFRVLGF